MECVDAPFTLRLPAQVGLASDAQQVHVARVVENTTVDWTLGALLYEAFLEPLHHESRPVAAVTAVTVDRDGGGTDPIRGSSGGSGSGMAGHVRRLHDVPRPEHPDANNVTSFAAIGVSARFPVASSPVPSSAVTTSCTQLSLRHNCRTLEPLLSLVWCLLSASWAVALAVLAWVAGCSGLIRRHCTAHGTKVPRHGWQWPLPLRASPHPEHAAASIRPG